MEPGARVGGYPLGVGRPPLGDRPTGRAPWRSRSSSPAAANAWNARRAKAALGSALRRAGHRAEAREHLREAIDLTARCGAHGRLRVRLAASRSSEDRSTFAAIDAAPRSSASRQATALSCSRPILGGVIRGTPTIDAIEIPDAASGSEGSADAIPGVTVVAGSERRLFR